MHVGQYDLLSMQYDNVSQMEYVFSGIESLEYFCTFEQNIFAKVQISFIKKDLRL